MSACLPKSFITLTLVVHYDFIFHFQSKTSTQINSQPPPSYLLPHHFHSLSNYLQLKCFSHCCKLQITLCFIHHSIRFFFFFFGIDNEKSFGRSSNKERKEGNFSPLLFINRVKEKLFQFTIIIVVIKIRMLIDSDNFSVLTSYNIP